MSNKTEIIELLEEANRLIYDAVDSLTRAKDLMKEESYGYNIVGNMEGYVTGYLTEGVDCISDKIDTYIQETQNLEEEDDEEEEEDDEEEEKFECPECGCYYWVKDRDGFECPNCEDKAREREDAEKDMPGGFFD